MVGLESSLVYPSGSSLTSGSFSHVRRLHEAAQAFHVLSSADEPLTCSALVALATSGETIFDVPSQREQSSMLYVLYLFLQELNNLYPSDQIAKIDIVLLQRRPEIIKRILQTIPFYREFMERLSQQSSEIWKINDLSIIPHVVSELNSIFVDLEFLLIYPSYLAEEGGDTLVVNDGTGFIVLDAASMIQTAKEIDYIASLAFENIPVSPEIQKILDELNSQSDIY